MRAQLRRRVMVGAHDELVDLAEAAGHRRELAACPRPSASSASTARTRSSTICRANQMSVPSLKITVTADSPERDTERSSTSLGTPFSAASIGNVTVRSTSTGDKPGRVGQHRHLHRRDVGHGVDRQRARGERAPADQRDQQHQHQAI